MISISLCMIVRNEESVLGRCLDCACQIADEIIVVDTGSVDNTIQVAQYYTQHVYSFDWVDDFSAARNFSFSKATGDYILWLDADDVIDPEHLQRLQELKNTLPPEVDAVMMRYNVAFDTQGAPTFSYYRERLVRRSCGFLWKEPVHEHLQISGEIRQYDIAITHGEKERGLSTRNLDIYEKRKALGVMFSSRALYYHARELRTHGRLQDAVNRYKEFLSRTDIWVEDALSASADLADCLMLTESDNAALYILLQSFSRAIPRAEILCRIGQIFQRREELEHAVFWYDLALQVPRPSGWGFVAEDYWGYIPHMQLCVLHDRLGQRERAIHHHEAAKALRPESEAVCHNEQYFYGS